MMPSSQVTMISKGIRRVAVIGAGPAGAIATDALVKEQAFDEVRVFERHSVAGGTWVYDPGLAHGIPSLRDLIAHQADLPIAVPDIVPCKTKRSVSNSYQNRFSDTAVHETLHSNLPPSSMSFTQEPLPETLSDKTLNQYGPAAPFRHRELIREWVEQIFYRGGHEKLISFNTTVERADKRGHNWVLTLRRELPGDEKDYWWQEEFDAAIVASGHYNIPYIPQIPGLAEYEDAFPGSIKHSKHFRSVDVFTGKRVIVVGGSVSAFDAIHEIRTVAKHPVISSLREPLPAFGWAPFTHPDILVWPPIARMDPGSRCIQFSDGTSVHDVDCVFFATGYDFSFPFLPNVKVEKGGIRGLYQHVFNIEDPTLVFIGMVTGGLAFRVFEWQAVAVARLFADRATLPSKCEMGKWEKEQLAQQEEGIAFSEIDDFETYFEALRCLAGNPAPGTTGRGLPPFEKKWEGEISLVIDARKKWWKREREIAEKAHDMGWTTSATQE
ncbi:thiol-specific monooxygenase [Xylariaceae sp. FL0662B]|nr:thiol-specific monooxygenase [Xylariaceae sp. FL0662B]